MVQKSKGEATREHILKISRQLFTLHGFQNTSVSTIIAATGVKKGNLYYHFPSKEELGLAVLSDARDEFFAFLDGTFQGKNPLTKIIHSCEALFEELGKNNFAGGCLFGNAALEMTDSNSKFAAIIQDVFARWTALIEEHLVKASDAHVAAGLIIPPPILATTIVATLEGGIMMSRVSKGRSGLEECIIALRAILGNPDKNH